MTQYRRRDIYNCYQNTGNWQDFMRWVEAVKGGPMMVGDMDFPDVSRNPDGSLALSTSMGLMVARVGDWVFQSSRGECMAIEERAFQKVFEPVEGAKDAPVLSLVMDPPGESPTGENAIVPDETPLPRIEWPSENNWEENIVYAFQLAESHPHHAEQIGLLLVDWFREPAAEPTVVLLTDTETNEAQAILDDKTT